jgi:hypothetical protein
VDRVRARLCGRNSHGLLVREVLALEQGRSGMMSWTARAARRGAGAVFLRPPVEHLRDRKWHVLDTPQGRKRFQWRPGIDVWLDEADARWTSEACGKMGFEYVGVSDMQR